MLRTKNAAKPRQSYTEVNDLTTNEEAIFVWDGWRRLMTTISNQSCYLETVLQHRSHSLQYSSPKRHLNKYLVFYSKFFAHITVVSFLFYFHTMCRLCTTCFQFSLYRQISSYVSHSPVFHTVTVTAYRNIVKIPQKQTPAKSPCLNR